MKKMKSKVLKFMYCVFLLFVMIISTPIIIFLFIIDFIFVSGTLLPFSIFEQSKNRMKICKQCNYYYPINKKFLINFGKCNSCGCALPHKTLIKNAKCPEKKW